MKERMVQLLDMEQLTPSKFADIIGVQRSSVSHVISGRNNPSFDFIQKTLQAFPGLNADWLILGKGTMYEQMGRQGSGTLFDDAEKVATTAGTEDQTLPEPNDIPEPELQRTDNGAAGHTVPSGGNGMKEPGGELIPGNLSKGDSANRAGKQISRIILLYDDDTFSSFEPS